MNEVIKYVIKLKNSEYLSVGDENFSDMPDFYSYPINDADYFTEDEVRKILEKTNKHIYLWNKEESTEIDGVWKVKIELLEKLEF